MDILNSLDNIRDQLHLLTLEVQAMAEESYQEKLSIKEVLS